MESALTVKEEHQQVRRKCGYFWMEDWALAQATGKDVFEYLQTQTTNDIKNLEIGQGQASAIVDRKARLIAPFSVFRTSENTVLFLVQAEIQERLLRHLETFLFREDVTIKSLSEKLLAFQGPLSALVMKQLTGLDSLPEKPNDWASSRWEGKEIQVIHKSFTGEEGYLLVLNPALKDKTISRIQELDPPHQCLPISLDTWDVLRIEAGIPLYGRDMSDKNILPETGLEHTSVSYHKGCYIGQEVIARIKTYGAPNFALMGLEIEGEDLPPENAEIRWNNKKIGTLKSTCHSPFLGKNIALAYIHKDHRSPDLNLEVTIQGETYSVKTCLLPFYQTQTRKDHSRKLTDQALKRYEKEEDLEGPIALLREAIELDPKNAQAYEALGVMLSKQDKLDEAISVMKRLAEIDPTEIMAHTNLSIYYMKQGRIEDAEKEKAEATAIQFEQMVAQNMAKKQKQQQEEKAHQERERQIEMFKQVLEIDPVDQIANFGLGSVYYEQGRYGEAVDPLRIVIRENKDYSAAYLLLGKNLEKLDQREEALEVYRQGIAAASKKGDLMPLKEMQNRQHQLLHSNA